MFRMLQNVFIQSLILFFLKEMSINQIDKSVNELEKMSNGTSFVDLKKVIKDKLSKLEN